MPILAFIIIVFAGISGFVGMAFILDEILKGSNSDYVAQVLMCVGAGLLTGIAAATALILDVLQGLRFKK